MILRHKITGKIIGIDDVDYLITDSNNFIHEYKKSDLLPLVPTWESLNDDTLTRHIRQELIAGKSFDQIMQPLNEGLFGSILGGLTGFALGKTVGEIICKVLGVGNGVLKDLLTSRLFGAALGAAIGKQV